eukprot:CAMPEP_0197440464 /NCGR_PEP_ID=MMETSP1175-20131217/6973_1 /TAXON_ID=1003142 /ORGANISM="Triceratium dubium, Strain CCMP147" /LENGTH=207 /DNA_ID=CAMNT_0042970571 /DNA_START=161 /DNA_END=781 /DNA_ORIENTATION=+
MVIIFVSSFYSAMASFTCSMTSSISRPFREGKGRFIPTSSTMGSSRPDTRTTKFPLPGFSLLISTTASEATAFCIFAARVLNAPHCLHASIVTTFFPVASATEEAAGSPEAVASFLAAFFFAVAAFFAGASAFFAFDDRVTRPMIPTTIKVSQNDVAYAIGASVRQGGAPCFAEDGRRLFTSYCSAILLFRMRLWTLDVMFFLFRWA